MAVETPLMRVTQERYRGRDIGGDYARVAEALGGWARRVERPEEIAPALAAAVARTESGAPALLEIVTSPAMTPFSCRRGSRDLDVPA
jgi:thiamine pyrophosphate-dependent acetolactate synthase large subunit-like protein